MSTYNVGYNVALPSFHLSYICLSAVKEHCDFEGGVTCGWEGVKPTSVPGHAFIWSPDQGESIHNGEEYHRPVTDHTL